MTSKQPPEDGLPDESNNFDGQVPGDGYFTRQSRRNQSTSHNVTMPEEEDQIDDGHCRAVLPMISQMVDFPEALQLMEDGLYTPAAAHGRGQARQATRASRGFVVLGGYTVIFFGLVCIFLRRKDRRLS